jgi:O-antigen ligase
MLPLTILQFYITGQNLSIEEDRENVVNNIAFMFVALIPFVFLLKKYKLISVVLLGIILMYIIMGNKRGAIITAALGTIIFAYYQFQTIEKRNRLRGFLVILIFVILLGYFAYYTYLNNEYLMNRMALISEGNSSGRDIIYGTIFNAWWNSNSIWNILFGYGFAGSLKLTGGSYAHNDWLELLSNFGLLGVSVYLYLFSATVKYIRNKKWESDKRILMLTITVMWFVTTIFSMWYSSIMVSTQAMLVAYLIGSKKSSLA